MTSLVTCLNVSNSQLFSIANFKLFAFAFTVFRGTTTSASRTTARTTTSMASSVRDATAAAADNNPNKFFEMFLEKNHWIGSNSRTRIALPNSVIRTLTAPRNIRDC